MTAILTHNLASLRAYGPDGQEPDHRRGDDTPTPGRPHITGHEQGDSRQPDEALRRAREADRRPQGLARVIIRTADPHLNRRLVRFAQQNGARMGNCGACGEATQPGACPRCGALVGRAPARELLLTAAVCPRCGGRGCSVCSYRGQV